MNNKLQIILLAICFLFGNKAFCSESKSVEIHAFNYEKVVSVKIIDETDICQIIELKDENGNILLNVVAAVATVFLPEAIDAVCERTVGDPEVCNTVYDITSTLVSKTGVGIYKGLARGMKWIANRGKKKSIAVVETNSYKIASGLKEVFFSYKKDCELGQGIPWEKVNYSEASNVVNQLEAKSVIVELFNSWENLDLNSYLDLWHPNAIQYTKKSTRYFRDLKSQRTSLFNRLSHVDVIDYELEMERVNNYEARINVEYSMKFYFNSGKIVSETNVEEMYIIKHDVSKGKWMILKNYDYINK